MSTYSVGVGTLTFLAVIAQGIIILIVASLLLRRSKIPSFFLSWIQKWPLALSFPVALTAVSGSLFFSEVIGFVPCALCWWQRIFMYPLAILLGVALLRRIDAKAMGSLIIPLCIIGGAISTYHYGLQMYALADPGFSDACSATGESCASTEILELGYITIPLMALSAFLLIALILLISFLAKKEGRPDTSL